MFKCSPSWLSFKKWLPNDYILHFQPNSYNMTIYIVDINKVDKQLTHAMYVKDRYANSTFIDKLTKWYQ